jgi:hypothetical protein
MIPGFFTFMPNNQPYKIIITQMRDTIFTNWKSFSQSDMGYLLSLEHCSNTYLWKAWTTEMIIIEADLSPQSNFQLFFYTKLI